MGRPRKEELSFKEQQMELPGVEEELTIEVIPEVKPEPVVYIGVTIGVFTNPKTQHQQIIEIPFTGDLQVGPANLISEPDGKGMAIERFKIEAQSRILDKLL